MSYSAKKNEKGPLVQSRFDKKNNDFPSEIRTQVPVLTSYVIR